MAPQCNQSHNLHATNYSITSQYQLHNIIYIATELVTPQPDNRTISISAVLPFNMHPPLGNHSKQLYYYTITISQLYLEYNTTKYGASRLPVMLLHSLPVTSHHQLLIYHFNCFPSLHYQVYNHHTISCATTLYTLLKQLYPNTNS